MDWRLDKSRPISRQLCELLCVAIASGEYRAGEKLLSVREIALQAGVNPNTVQKSLEELERKEVIHSVPSSGWYVNENTEAAQNEVEALRQMRSLEYLQSMAQLGCNTAAAVEYVKAISEREANDSE